jgi:hypothetical protein
MINTKQSNRGFAVGIGASLVTSLLLVVATLASALGDMQVYV